ncbi:MAG: DNA mismatch repair protein MutS [Acidobacteria bacterium]|nr:DNA mismatch repair protein MutS [Acidobacteriota bacterium]
MNDHATPMMRQYQEVKRRFPGKLVFFRLGDFYEMFFDDAVTASREMEITLTSRNRDRGGEPIPMCGVPHHALEGYLTKLVRKGYKVVVCEQTEDPRPGHLVRREVSRVVTPGTVTEDAMLDPRTNNFLAGVVQRGDGFGAAFLDVSTGDFFVTQYRGEEPGARLAAEVNHFQPAEILYPPSNAPLFADRTMKVLLEDTVRTELEEEAFRPDTARARLLEVLKTSSLAGFGLEGRDLAEAAAGAVVHYARDGNLLNLENLDGIRYFESTDFLRLDAESIANLELITAGGGGRKHTLLSVLDHTVTGMGGRLLKSWILRPLLDLEEIHRRHGAVGELFGSFRARDTLRRCLSGILDVERLMGKVTLGTVRPRELLALKVSLGRFPELNALLGGLDAPLFRELSLRFDPAEDLWELLERTLHEDPPATINEGGLIRDGYRADLDELRALAHGGKSLIAGIEARERERTGISSLKIGYNRVFGYFLEVTRANAHLVPEDYIRKQTLVNAERYVTPELKELEEKVLHAEERMVTLEREIFQEARRSVAEQSRRVLASARVAAAVDVLAALAEAAVRNRYARPDVDASLVLEVRNGRHPVVERTEESFIPNDCLLDGEENQLVVLTGPNMGGKSTYLRQAALIVILAQMGSFVPADAARVGIVDQVFTRVGASDNLAQGRSTFMVEMIETANILNTCTPRSLVLLDEVGRGTATFDGLSIAWSVAEFLLVTEGRNARTLFATHYHELTRLDDLYPNVKNYCVTVREGVDEIVFLRKVVAGRGARSYGIEVARLAGMPREVTQRATEILRKLERKEIDLAGRSKPALAPAPYVQKRLFE